MNKRLRIVAATLVVVAAVGAAVVAPLTKPETQEFTRAFIVLEKEAVPGERYGFIATSTALYRVTLETESGNNVTARPNRDKYLQFPAVGKSVTLTYESTDEGGRLITNILEVRNGN